MDASDYAAIAGVIKVKLRSLTMRQPRRREPGPEDLLSSANAAMLLGVSQPTLRRWDDLGKFNARRHAINGYRICLRGDVMKLRKKIFDRERAA